MRYLQKLAKTGHFIGARCALNKITIIFELNSNQTANFFSRVTLVHTRGGFGPFGHADRSGSVRKKGSFRV